MTGSLAITTFVGAFTFPFLLRIMFGDFVEKFGPIGGWLAASFIIGTTWCMNHGVGLIHQTGAHVDMGYAAGFGLFVASLVGDKADLGKGLVTMVEAIIGGLIAAYVISCMG
jgi:uncharacterized protein (DUF697 family)